MAGNFSTVDRQRSFRKKISRTSKAEYECSKIKANATQIQQTLGLMYTVLIK